VDILHADRFHTLKKKRGREAAAGDLVDDVLFGVFHTDCLESVGEMSAGAARDLLG
jgi:hypothetical protein